MLVIARKQNEFIQIGEDIVVKVIRTGKGSVKIGIDAPNGMRVLRGELALDDEDLEQHFVSCRVRESANSAAAKVQTIEVL